MKAIFTRLIGAAGSGAVAYGSTGSWHNALVTFGAFAVYGIIHPVTAGATGSPPAP